MQYADSFVGFFRVVVVVTTKQNKRAPYVYITGYFCMYDDCHSGQTIRVKLHMHTGWLQQNDDIIYIGD